MDPHLSPHVKPPPPSLFILTATLSLLSLIPSPSPSLMIESSSPMSPSSFYLSQIKTSKKVRTSLH